MALMGDEDTCTGFLLTGVGNVDSARKKNFLVVTSRTPVEQIEEAFKEFITRADIRILLITQPVADEIRHLLVLHTSAIPAILEIPTKDRPYDGSRDWIMKRVKSMFGQGD